MKKIFLAAAALMMMSCNVEAQDVEKSEESESLEHWTNNNIFRNNAELVRLIDPLYQYVKNDNFPSKDVNKDLMWMNQYRQTLCKYYDTHKLGKLSVSEYAKADSVAALSGEVYNMDGSTFDMVLSSDVARAFMHLRNYGLLSQILDKCETDAQKMLVKSEFTAWIEMEKVYTPVSVAIAWFPNWGGSISRVNGAATACWSINRHIKMYEQQLAIMSDDTALFDGERMYVEPAKGLLLECVKTSVDKSKWIGEQNDQYYIETVNMINESMTKLPVLIDKWATASQLSAEALGLERYGFDIEWLAGGLLLSYAKGVVN